MPKDFPSCQICIVQCFLYDNLQEQSSTATGPPRNGPRPLRVCGSVLKTLKYITPKADNWTDKHPLLHREMWPTSWPVIEISRLTCSNKQAGILGETSGPSLSGLRSSLLRCAVAVTYCH